MREIIKPDETKPVVERLPSARVGITARTDWQAVDAWLQEYRSNKNTFIKYKFESDRFSAWLHQQNLTLLDLKKEHLHRYITWLEQSLSYVGVKYNLRIINSLLNYLAEAEYIHKNPLRLIKKKVVQQGGNERAKQVQSRILEADELAAVVYTINTLPEHTKSQLEEKLRIQLMVALFYHLGLRVFELCQARWDDFKIIQGQCWYCLVGKGGKAGQIPVNEELLDLVQRYRGYYQLTVNVSEFDTGLIFVSKRTGGQLSHSRVRQIIKGVFRKASEQVEGKAKKDKLCKCSPHDFRHILASQLDSLGLSILESKEILRHSSEKTTEIYRHSLESKRHAAIQSNRLGIEKIENKAQQQKFLKISIRCEKSKILQFSYFLKALNTYLDRVLSEKQLDSYTNEFEVLAPKLATLALNIPLSSGDNAVVGKVKNFIEIAASSRGIVVGSVSY